MQRSSLAKWALTRRFEAHFGLPALLGLALVTTYFLAPEMLRAMIVPGLIDLPFLHGRTIGIAHLITGICMAWILILGASILVITGNGWLRLWTIAVLAVVVFILSMWLDGQSLTSRAAALWMLTEAEQGSWSHFLAAWPALLDLLAMGAFSLVFFVVLPLLRGASPDATVATLVPNRWSIATAATLFGSFWLAFRLEGRGWTPAGDTAATLAADYPMLLLPLFFYTLLLYVARIQYRCWVRREAGDWKRNLNTP